jgi:phage-related holin
VSDLDSSVIGHQDVFIPLLPLLLLENPLFSIFVLLDLLEDLKRHLFVHFFGRVDLQLGLVEVLFNLDIQATVVAHIYFAKVDVHLTSARDVMVIVIVIIIILVIRFDGYFAVRTLNSRFSNLYVRLTGVICVVFDFNFVVFSLHLDVAGF